MGSCLDLRKYQDNPDIAAVFGKLVSGKAGYKAVIEKRKDIIRCKSCGKILEGEEKFCPECGTPVPKPIK
jgi:rRNA maturation endonuclease Nob1